VNRKFSESRPIFQQIKEYIEDGIIEGRFAEGEKIPSTNEFAEFFQINPATAAKGVNLLVEEGILFKRRGLGMFVTEGAKKKLKDKRKEIFAREYVQKMLEEAERLNISVEELKGIIEEKREVMKK